MDVESHNLWKKLKELAGSSKAVVFPRLGAAAQARLSWADEVKSYEQVPEPFRGFFDDLLGESDGFPYSVLTPSYQGFLTPESRKLVCSHAGKIYILEMARERPRVTCFPAADILAVEVGCLLLKAWVTLRGFSSEGELASVTLKYNSVTDYLFTPFVDQVRPSLPTLQAADLLAERRKFDYLERLNFKFMNYARKSIRPGDRVECTVLQPEIRSHSRRAALFRTLNPAHIDILTGRELILIRDEDPGWWTRGRRHGGIWTYVPLDRVTSVSLQQKEEGRLALSIFLRKIDRLELVYSDSNRDAVEDLLGRLAEVAPWVAVEVEAPRPALTTLMV